MSRDNRKGIWLMAGFAVQDGVSRHLAATCDILMIVMLRHRVFAGFAAMLARHRPKDLRAAIRLARPGAHLLPAALLVIGVSIIVRGYTLIGPTGSHTVLAICPLLIMTMMSGPFLGERPDWQRRVVAGIPALWQEHRKIRIPET